MPTQFYKNIMPKNAANGALLILGLDYEYETEKLVITKQVLWEGHAFVPIIYCHSSVPFLEATDAS